MPTRIRIIMVSIIILLGGALFSYCAFCYPENPACSTVLASSNAGSASTGNKEQDKTGQNSKTRSERKSPPRTGAI
ncbi:MAG: hypothetical protein JW787_12100 [Sedimentisphaerales bacterium]|nr:hypothetical protein [Sedimentisphaerales bacterium]